MDDVTDDVIIARPFETDHRIFRVWHMSLVPHFSSLLAFLCLLRW